MKFITGVSLTALTLSLSLATYAGSHSKTGGAVQFLVDATQAATAQDSDCDVAFLQEYISVVGSQFPDRAHSIFVRADRTLVLPEEKACLREALKTLGLGIDS